MTIVDEHDYRVALTSERAVAALDRARMAECSERSPDGCRPFPSASYGGSR